VSGFLLDTNIEKPYVWVAKVESAPGLSSAFDLAPDGTRVALLTPVETVDPLF
jgi:hypothetical protein